jgi:transcription antitermination factor NusG
MTTHWYVLQSHPNKEDLLWKQVRAQGMEAFYPFYTVNPVNPRSRKIRPYFPGYIFIKANLSALGFSVFQWMPYTLGLVFLGGEPASVSEEFISLLRHHLEKMNLQELNRYIGFRPGDPVTIRTGPFAYYSGLFDCQIPGTERVRILLKMLSDRIIPVEMSMSLIEKQIA